MMDMHIYACAHTYTHTLYFITGVLAKQLPVLVSVKLNKQTEQTILIITNSNTILLNQV